MKKCCFFIPLKRGVATLGFLGMIIAIAELMLSHYFNHGDVKVIDTVRSKTKHIVSLIEELVDKKKLNSGHQIRLEEHAHLIFNCVTGRCLTITIEKLLLLNFEMVHTPPPITLSS